MLKKLVQAAALRLGYTIIPTYRLAAYPAAQHLKRLFAHLDIDLVLDVGANNGQFRDWLRSDVGYAGPVVSFEPVPALAQALAVRAATDPAWTVHGKALGATPGSAVFNIMAETQFSSFHQPRHDLVGLFTQGNAVQDRVTVDIGTLDQELPGLVAKAGARNIYLKIDTQGFDLDVLRGAEAVLGQIAALQTEASVQAIYTDAPGYQQVVDWLVARGFVISGFAPNNDGHFPQLVEFDCVMIQASRAGRPPLPA